MTHVQKGAKYTLKNLLGKTREENDLRMKVLRYVMAVGFVLSPWLGGEAYADAGNIVRVGDATNQNLMQNGVAHIYAEQVDTANKVGFNRFQTFNVAAGEIANLYFQKEAGGATLNSLVNTVESQISISGTVNAIRNNEVGGKLYFLSPKGMVVGSTGVINAGALTVITTGIDDITDPDKAMTAITAVSTNNTYRALTDQPIEIHGQINTVNGIDLRSLSIAISKDSGSDIKPYLKTGVVFETIVNTNELNGLVGEVKLKSERSDSTDTKIELCAYKTYWDDYWEVTTPQFGNITLSECGLDAIGGIEIVGGQRVDVDNTTVIKSQDLIKFDLEHGDVGVLAIDNCRIETEGLIDMRVGNTITIGGDAYIISKITKNDTTSKVTLLTSIGDITNNGTISTKTSLDIQAGVKRGSDDASITNSGTIQATGGGMSFTVDKSLTNNGLIQADDQISFTVGGTLTNEGKIESTSSNVQAHIGRNFKNLGDSNSESSQKGFIQAGGNVQVDYNLDTEHTGIGVASPGEGEEATIDGIYNSGLIQANGNDKPESEGGVIDMNSGSGNIWLTSSYNITNYGNMIAGRQITLNARDFLHNYGLIQGVTYLDIKSIMGYVYNHNDGVIRATGGNIDLSSGQANLQIKNDTDGQKKELYRKFTPIIIEGIVQATSDDDRSNQTREGNIKITAYLGDIYINGGTIETKPELGTNGEVKEVAGDVILDAAQNITIGFDTEKAWGDDPTTDAPDNREYYINTTPSQKAAKINGTEITLTSGSGKTISMSEVDNVLTASNAITINTDNMNIVGGTFNANTLAASKNLNIAGGTINVGTVTTGGGLNIASNSLDPSKTTIITANNITAGGSIGITGGDITTSNVTAGGQLSVMSGVSSTGSLSLNGVEAVTIGGSAGISSIGDLSVTSDGSVTLTGNAGASDEAIIQAGGDVSIASTASNIQNSKVITAGKNVSMTATQGSVENSMAITAGTSAVGIGNIELTAGNGISLTNAYELTADGTVELNTANMNITTGTINADTLEASGALTISGSSTINAANVTAGGAMSIAGGAINTGTSQGRLTATSINMSDGSITGKNVTLSGDEQVQLQGGSLIADAATLEVKKNASGDSIVESAIGFTLDVDSLSVSANKGAIKLNGSGNILQSVTLANADGNVTIVNGNDNNHNVLTVSTAGTNKVQGAINITNNGADIIVAGVNASDAVNLTAGENITVAGGVAAANASFGAGVDFVHNSGAIAAGEVVVTAGQNVQLNGGSMVVAKSASLTANAGSIAEQAVYAIDAPKVTTSATGAINLDSTANQLVNVKVTKVGGDLTIGSGNKKSADNLQVDVAQNVDGNLTLKNYSVAGDENANSIVVTGELSATKNISITNAEANINVGTDATIDASNISLEANSGTVNVTGNAFITTANTGTFTANANNIIMAGGQITAGTATITSNGTADGSGFTMNGGTITAGTANITSAKAINQTAGSIVAENTVATAGSNLGLASSANKLQNVTVAADKGSVIIVSGNDQAGDLNVHTVGTIGGTLSITNADDGVADGVNNAIVIDNNLLANDSITITNQEADINLAAGSTLTSENGDVTIGSVNNVVSAGAINAGTLAASGHLNITGGTINVTNLNANNAMSVTGGTIAASEITATGAMSVGDGIVTASKVTAQKTLSVTGGTINAANVAVTEAMSIAGGTIKNDTGKVSVRAASIKMSGGTVEGSDVEIATTGNYEQTKGAVAGDVASINAKNMTISGGSITGKNVNISANEQVQLQSGSITVQNSNAGRLTVSAGNVLHNGATVKADNATINAVSGISLTSGSLTAQEAALNVTNSSNENSIVEGADYSLVVNSLSVSANKGAIKLNGNGNVLQSVTFANTDGDITIVNGNDTNHKALNVSTAGTDKVQGAINITNNGADITVGGVNARDAVNLTTGENITVTGAVNASGATLQAAKGIDLTGSINTTGNASLTAGENIKVAGDVNAANASFGAGVDFIHNSGAIAAGEVVVTAGQNVQLSVGSMVAGDSASLTANAGSIAEQAEYAIDALQVTASAAKYAALDSTANQLVNVKVTKVGGDLTIGSGNTKSDAALQIATPDTIQGNLTVTNYASDGDAKANDIVFGNDLNATGNIILTNQETDINIGQGLAITSASESVTISSAGNVAVAGTVDAAKNASLVAGKGMSVSGSLEAASAAMQAGENIALSGTITANDVNLNAAQAISQTAGSIVATNTVATAGSDLSLASSANKLQNVTVKADDGSVIIVSGNDKAGDLNVKTDGTIGGTLSITNVANGAENDIVIEQNLLANGSITINNQEAGINLGKDVRITSNIGGINITALKNMFSAGIIDAANGIVLEAINKILDITGGSITAKGGSIALHGKDGINNGASIAAKGNVGLYSTGGRITNSADITAGKNFASATKRAAFYSLRAVAQETEEIGSVTMSGKYGVTNTASASVSAEQSVSMTSTAGSVNNSSVVTSNSGAVVISGQTGVTNEGKLTATTGSVTMSGNGDVTNTATITAGTDVSMSSTTGDVQNSGTIKADQSVGMTAATGDISNSGTIEADQSVGMTATAGAVTNSNDVNAGTGTVTMSGKMGVVNDNTGATISAGSGVSMTSSAEGVTNNSTVTSTSGTVEMDGQKTVTNTGAVTATGGSVEISGSSVANTGAVTASGGSVTMSGDGGVTNKANITAGTDVSMNSTTGDVETSGKIEVGNAVSMTSTEGNISSSSEVTANTGSVEISGSEVANTGAVTASGGSITMSGDSGITNKANITAGTDVSMNSTTGDVETTGKIEAGNAVSMTSTEGNISSSSEVTANTGSVVISGSSVANTGAVTASGGSVTMSGDSGVTNNATISAATDVKMSSTTGDVATSGKIEANKNVNISADAGAITNIGSVTSEAGNIVLTSDQGITSKDGEASLITESLNGSISAATTYGEVNISEIIAGNTASVSSQNGSVIIGSVSGSDVVLTGGDSVSIGTVAGNDVVLTGGSDVTIDSVSGKDVAISGGSNSDVNVDNITVDNSLKLQGDNITVSNVAPSNTTETNKLTVDVNGADGAGSAVQGSLELNVKGDVVFDNLNVTNANVTASGNIDVNKLGVDDKGQAQLTSNKNPENENGTTVTVVGKDAAPDAGSGNVIVAPGNDSDTWLNIKMDEEGSKTTVVDDAGRDVNNKDYPAQMSAKLVDYDPYDTYLEHYADMADIFSRSYLIDTPERSSSDILSPVQGGRVVLKQDANGLHLEIVEEQSEQEA